MRQHVRITDRQEGELVPSGHPQTQAKASIIRLAHRRASSIQLHRATFLPPRAATFVPLRDDTHSTPHAVVQPTPDDDGQNNAKVNQMIATRDRRR
jgi:hypothetical protein